MVKRCGSCNEYLNISKFYKNQSYCIDCKRKYQKKYMNDTVYSDKNSKKYLIQKMRTSLSRGNSLSYLKEYLGCSNEFFFKWLEFQRSLTPESIIKKEHLDHVLPIKHFKDKPHICWFWVNIKPISQSENLQKSGSLNFNLFFQQISISQFFLQNYQFTSFEEKNQVINQWFKIFSDPIHRNSSITDFLTLTQVPNY